MKKNLWKKVVSLWVAINMLMGTAITASAAGTVSQISIPDKAINVEDKTTNQTYLNNQGELTENPLKQLPLGAVKADSWLENQLLLMKNGLTGNMRLFDDYNEATSAWLGASDGEAWENGPYYVRGLVSLAYTLNDQDLISEALKWVSASIDSQQPNGYFGPQHNQEWWSRMPMLCAIRDFYEAVDAKPLIERTEKEVAYYDKVIPFLEQYFRYQESELPVRGLNDWAKARGGDNLEVVYWLYNKQFNQDKPNDTKWLLNLGELIYSQTDNWENIYNNTTVTTHVVNTSQGMKTPALYSQYKGDEKYKTALANGLANMSIDHGRIDGLPNSDERARENRSTRGSETCSTVEALLSTGIAMRISGEAWMGDRMEQLAYNALPAAYPSDYSGHAYYILQNQVMNTLGNHEFDCDHGDSSAFGAPGGFDCCFANNHMGWSKFVQNMWMATKNNGLAIMSYGPNHVTAKVAGDKTAKFQQRTDYPFKDTINLEYFGDSAEFELQLRIPEWAVAAEISINGQPQQGVMSGEFYTLTKEWKPGDLVTATFKSEVTLTTWYNNSTAVQKGALIYGLQIAEDWRTYDSNDARELKDKHQDGFPLREVYPASAWNYGLVTDGNASFEVIEESEVPLQPFNSENAPVKIVAKGKLLPEWTLDGNIAGPQPYGPIAYHEDEVEDITLIPYGCGRLRITHFPTLGDEKQTNAVIRTQSQTRTRNGITYQEFDNLVVPKAKDYKLVVKAEGSGTITINNKYVEQVAGDFEISNLKSKLSGGFKFDQGQYNNVRFTGDITVSEVKVEVIEREITEINVIKASRNDSVIKISTNLDAQETPYKVVYGIEEGVYTKTVRGFSGSVATLTGTDSQQKYYAKVVATICGIEQESAEIVIETSESSGGLKPNPNVPAAAYGGFSTLNYMVQEWTKYDPNNKVSIQAAEHPNTTKLSEIKFGDGTKMKAVLDIQGAGNWVDYVVETDLSVDQLKNNNGGIMFRSSNIGNGPDEYNGYYVGIGKAGTAPGFMIGYSNGNWHDIKIIPADIQPNQKYTLKVVVYGDLFAAYLDDNLMYIGDASDFEKGTIGVRSYTEAMTVHDVRVKPIAETDLAVFEPDAPEVPEVPETPEPPEVPEELVPHTEHGGASYEGFGLDAQALEQDFTTFDPNNKISFVDSEDGPQIKFAKGEKVKALLNRPDSESWIDYVVEGTVSVDLVDFNNCGIMFRATQVGDDPDAYHGYFVGVGMAGSKPGLMIGYADGTSWKDIQKVPMPIAAGQIYKLKVVAFDNQFAVYLDDQFITKFENDLFEAGTVGLRSYNEAFTSYDLTVRDIVQEDLADLQPEVETMPETEETQAMVTEAPSMPELPAPEPSTLEMQAEEEKDTNGPQFSDDFSSQESLNNWTKIGRQDLIKVQDGQLQLGNSDNIKAMAGQEEWQNLVYTAVIKLGTEKGENAGMLFRSTKEGPGSDNYYGYYFGISGTKYEIGKSSNKWTQLKLGDCALDTGVPHELKVIAYEDTFLFYIDGQYIDRVFDNTHSQGRIGVRGFNRSMAVDEVEVRPLTAEEIEAAMEASEDRDKIKIEGYSSYDSIQVKFPRVMNATSYRILFGNESGIYNNEFVDIFFNGYKGSAPFTHDKAAFSTRGLGTYYVKVLGMNGTTPVASSNEVMITTGERADTQLEKDKMSTAINVANGTDISAFTKVSEERYQRSLNYALEVAGKEQANQMDYATASNLLYVAVNTPNSMEFVNEEKTVDTKVLDQAIKDAKALKADDYTPESYAKVKSALEKAQSVDRTNQVEVDAVTKALNDTLKQLVKKPVVKPVDLTALNKAIAAAKKLNASKYTPTSYAVVKTALTKAEAVNKKDQKAVDGATKTLNTAIAKLVLKPVVPKKNAVLTSGKLVYKVTKSAAKNGTVSVMRTAKKTYTSITIPKTVKLNGFTFKVTEIGKNAFKSNKSLKTVKIGDYVTKIGTTAFANCKKLKTVTMGKGIKSIGSKAFYGDKVLKKVVIKSTKITKVYSNAFKGIHKKGVITVPKKKVKQYKKIFKKGGQSATVKIK